MTRSNIKALLATAPNDETFDDAKSTLQFEIMERLLWLANSIKSDAYAGVSSEKLISKFLIEIEILKYRAGDLSV